MISQIYNHLVNSVTPIRLAWSALLALGITSSIVKNFAILTCFPLTFMMKTVNLT